MLRKELANIKCGPEDLKKFGLSVGTVLMIFGLVLRIYNNEYDWIVFLVGMTLLILGLLKLPILRPIHRSWMAFAAIMGWFMTRVILSLFFYLILTPIALVARLSGNRFLELKRDKSRESYWHYRDKNEKLNYKNQF